MQGRFTIKVIPNSREESVLETADGLTVKVNAPAREGLANERMIELVARHFRIPKSRIRLTAGARSKTKRIQIS